MSTPLVKMIKHKYIQDSMLDARSVFSFHVYLHGPISLSSLGLWFQHNRPSESTLLCAPRHALVHTLSLTSSWPLREAGGGPEKPIGW